MQKIVRSLIQVDNHLVCYSIRQLFSVLFNLTIIKFLIKLDNHSASYSVRQAFRVLFK